MVQSKRIQSQCRQFFHGHGILPRRFAVEFCRGKFPRNFAVEHFHGRDFDGIPSFRGFRPRLLSLLFLFRGIPFITSNPIPPNSFTRQPTKHRRRPPKELTNKTVRGVTGIGRLVHGQPGTQGVRGAGGNRGQTYLSILLEVTRNPETLKS